MQALCSHSSLRKQSLYPVHPGSIASLVVPRQYTTHRLRRSGIALDSPAVATLAMNALTIGLMNEGTTSFRVRAHWGTPETANK